MMKLPEHRPLRVLFSGCLLGEAVNFRGEHNGDDLARLLSTHPQVEAVRFCPEARALGVPRPMTTLHSGTGDDALAGNAVVLGTDGEDYTQALVDGARDAVGEALVQSIDLVVAMEGSDSCGVHLVLQGDPARRSFRRGHGIAVALLRTAGIPVVSHLDREILGSILERLGGDRPEDTTHNTVDLAVFRDAH